METLAYVFVEVKYGQSREVSKEIKKIQGVQASHVVTGPYDIIVFAKAPDIQQFGNMVISKIQKVPGVLRTITNVVAE